MLNTMNNYMRYTMNYNFYLKERKLSNVINLYAIYKELYVHIRILKQALNYGLVLKKVHRIINFNQKAWFKPYIYMNIRLKTEAKNDFENKVFKLMKNPVFGRRWKTFDEGFIKVYNENSNKEYIFEIEIEYPKHKTTT